jgi:hypothetical protein
MKTSKRRCKCLHCKGLFLPDYRNRGRQSYCAKLECRRMSRQRSQQLWLGKPENQKYFHGPSHVLRVQEWRKSHPGYWKRPGGNLEVALQEPCSAQLPVSKEVPPNNLTLTLQDLCSLQVPLFVGLISMLTAGTLQEDIAVTTRRIVAKGHDILGMVPRMNFERFNE